MKSLKSIQTISKVGKVLSTIVFVCSIVGASICFLALLLFVATGNMQAEDGRTIFETIYEEEEISSIGMYSTLITAIITCGAEIFLAKKAEIYFKNELKEGTPFTHPLSKELRKLGIICIIVTAAVALVAAIISAIAMMKDSSIEGLDYTNFDSIWLGITFIVVSLLCDYGADLKEDKKEVEVIDAEIKE